MPGAGGWATELPKEGRGRSSGLGRCHPRQVHEEVPKLRHVHVLSGGRAGSLPMKSQSRTELGGTAKTASRHAWLLLTAMR